MSPRLQVPERPTVRPPQKDRSAPVWAVRPRRADSPSGCQLQPGQVCEETRAADSSGARARPAGRRCPRGLQGRCNPRGGPEAPRRELADGRWDPQEGDPRRVHEAGTGGSKARRRAPGSSRRETCLSDQLVRQQEARYLRIINPSPGAGGGGGEARGGGCRGRGRPEEGGAGGRGRGEPKERPQRADGGEGDCPLSSVPNVETRGIYLGGQGAFVGVAATGRHGPFPSQKTRD